MVEIPSYALPIKFLCQVKNSLSKVTEQKKILLKYDSWIYWEYASQQWSSFVWSVIREYTKGSCVEGTRFLYVNFSYSFVTVQVVTAESPKLLWRTHTILTQKSNRVLTCRVSAACSSLHLNSTEVDEHFFSTSCFNFLTSFQVQAT